ncbi:hypothetical protein [Paractinoplanes toevensis]|uniref:Uncharacterized protein n=1 Tax=Paractinoplanes toevensis TaxID=571911 RepID=A0A919T9L4_9ACTN|nr:hypothetical protein [Actinoplanes toevensis]GIM90400.1 hypothetical protein Ato02nite_021930 [Actinoplanes toevensis]
MRRSQVLVVATVALGLLSACGSPKEKEASQGTKVATLASSAATPSAAATAQRPRERLDTTPEEFEAMLGPYNKCMKEHGFTSKGQVAGSEARPATEKEKSAADEANRICEPQFYPLPPWEKDPANPEARDFARDVVKCLKNKGIKYVEVADDGISLSLGGEQNDPTSIRRGLDLAPECERTVAAAMKK